jgi:sarcosine oxidase subunit beta
MTTARGSGGRADVVIVGAGVMGLAIAYNLAARGGRRIVVLRLMQESTEICARFAEEMGINVWMRRGGYLFLARSKAAGERLERNVALQNRCDLPTRMIALEEARDLVPELELGPGAHGGSGFVAACYNPTDAIVFPWPFLWGYARAAERRGVQIQTGVPVTAIDRRGDDFVLTTPQGALTAGRVVCAAGAWSPRVARLAGGALPDRPVRHEILSTEPLKPFLKPMVSVIESGLYVSQSLRGELVGGISMPEEPNPDGEVRLGSRLDFLTTMAHGLVALMPRLGHVKVVRQWAGPYDVSPDGNPIVGELPGVPGFYVVCGFGGHGFMMAPVVARHYAAYLDGEPPHPFFTAWRADRFAPGGAPPSADREEMIIG